MNKISFYLIFLILITISPVAHAKNYTVIFWYPGEAGSSVEAQPILDTLFDYLSEKIKGSEFSGSYYNDNAKGLTEIKKQKPDFVITSWVALQENRTTLPKYDKLAATLPYPFGRDKDEFTIVGKRGEGDWPPDPLEIYSSIPMTLSFFKTYLAPGLNTKTSIQQTKTILMKLKKIASGEEKGKVALLTPMEFNTLENLSSSWKGGLATLYKCRPVPTAELIYFGSRPPVADNLLKVLAEMKKDPEGREILESLRLKGFK